MIRNGVGCHAFGTPEIVNIDQGSQFTAEEFDHAMKEWTLS
jgi:hypothetical protein